MNAVARYLESRRESPKLEGLRAACDGTEQYVVVTPRFRASSHVVVLVIPRGSPVPAFVAKLPRLRERTWALAREARNLERVQALRAGGFESIPRLLAYDEEAPWPILLETALPGQPLDPRALRRAPARACAAVLDWLCELQAAGPAGEHGEKWLRRLLDEPLPRCLELLSPGAAEERALALAREALTSLAQLERPCTFEHGDLSHPNLVLTRDGRLGAFDWELADADGLPGADLFFFLAYAAFARARAREPRAQLAAFHRAFFGTDGWARAIARDYARRVGLPPELLAPLFLFTWVRCLARQLEHVEGPGAAADSSTPVWLRESRWSLIARHALAHAAELHFHEG